MKRNPNDPIPGFDEYTGTVGHEKKFHKTHFQGVFAHPVHPKDDPDWEYVGVGRWRKKPNIGAHSAEVIHDVQTSRVSANPPTARRVRQATAD